MQEVQKIAFLLLKFNILKEKVKRLVLKLPSSQDIKQTQINKVTTNLLNQMGAHDQVSLLQTKLTHKNSAGRVS